jgi:Flp pilus assembly protein TadD
MKNAIRSLFLSGLLGLVLVSSATAQNTNRVTGFVFNESRVPVSNVYVEIQTEFYSTVSRIRTPGSGQYSFAGLPSGIYYIKVLTAGTEYEEQSRSVSLVPVSVIAGRGSVTEQVDFYLRTRKNRSPGTLGAPAVVFAQDIPTESSGLYNEAVQALSTGDEVAAYEKLKRSIELFPDYYLALNRLGTEYLNKGFYEASALLLAKALSVNKRSTSSSLGLGLSLFRLGKVDGAVDQFENVVKLDPESANGHLWLGISRHGQKKFPEALRSLLKANEITGGTSAEVHWQLARVYKDQNRFDRAAAELELFLKYRPEAENQAEIKQVIASLRKKE